jgi:hypothetical protein
VPRQRNWDDGNRTEAESGEHSDEEDLFAGSAEDVAADETRRKVELFALADNVLGLSGADLELALDDAVKRFAGQTEGTFAATSLEDWINDKLSDLVTSTSALGDATEEQRVNPETPRPRCRIAGAVVSESQKANRSTK